MMEQSPFDHRPDPAMAEALRDVLPVGDSHPFVRQVVQRLAAPEQWWEILGDWARPAVAAAILLTATAGFLLGRMLGPAPTGIADAEPGVAGMGLEVSVLLSDESPPDVEALLGDGTP